MSKYFYIHQEHFDKYYLAKIVFDNKRLVTSGENLDSDIGDERYVIDFDNYLGTQVIIPMLSSPREILRIDKELKRLLVKYHLEKILPRKLFLKL